jgi:murein L,D-transpeptidase YafK
MSPLAKYTTALVVELAFSISPQALLSADRVIIHKSVRTLELMRAGQVLKTYKIALGSEPVGRKTRQGDHRTPEGIYVIDSRNAHSQFHRSLHISYPNAVDREHARKMNASPG